MSRLLLWLLSYRQGPLYTVLPRVEIARMEFPAEDETSGGHSSGFLSRD